MIYLVIDQLRIGSIVKKIRRVYSVAKKTVSVTLIQAILKRNGLFPIFSKIIDISLCIQFGDRVRFIMKVDKYSEYKSQTTKKEYQRILTSRKINFMVSKY